MSFSFSHCVSMRITLSAIAGLFLVITYYGLKYYQTRCIELHNLKLSRMEYNTCVKVNIFLESFYAIFLFIANYKYLLNQVVIFYHNRYKSMLVMFSYFLLLAFNLKYSVVDKDLTRRSFLRDVILYPFFEEFFFRHVFFQNLTYGMVGIERIWIDKGHHSSSHTDIRDTSHVHDGEEEIAHEHTNRAAAKDSIVHRKEIIKDLNIYTVFETAELTFFMVLFYLIIISSVLFATAHYFYEVIVINDYIYRLISGIFYTIFVDVTHNLIVSLACHSVHNLAVLLCRNKVGVCS